ncbi:MAG: hypothetical protein EPO11_00150 [Gammaproteobacteria bacterium]|nr:MAG: hypothetical protein EPO11_00150 [Gammaproteobacteria bacterium]
MEQKNIFIVLGMARSGTSAITRSLKALGIELGDKLTKGREKWNPTGFWEDNEIVYKIHKEIFSCLNFPPYGIETPDRDQLLSEQLQYIRNFAIELLKQRFANTCYWAFKDPSTVKLLPFWQSILDELAIKEHYIISLRHPLAVAQSYHRVTGHDIEVGLLLWIAHVIPAIDETLRKKNVVVSYDLLLQKPKEQLERIKNHLAIPTLTKNLEIDFYTNQFLDKNLQHFDGKVDLQPPKQIINFCMKVYQLGMQLAQDEITSEHEAFLSSWQEIKNELEEIYSVYCYVDKLLKRIHQLENQLRNINKSIAWKMLYPLRKVDDLLRARRKDIRKLNRLLKAY